MRQTWKACLLAALFALTALSASGQTPAKTSTTIQKEVVSAKRGKVIRAYPPGYAQLMKHLNQTDTVAQKKSASAKILNQAQQAQGLSQEQTELKKSRSQTATASSEQTAPCKKPMARINASTGKVTILNKKTHKKN